MRDGESRAMKARENPFRAERMDGIRYRFVESAWPALMARLEALGYRGAILGPDGSGKTTLLDELAPRLAGAGFSVKRLFLNREEPRFPAGFVEAFAGGLGPDDAILFDGADLLGRPAWRRFRRLTARAGGLVVTSHRRGLLPTLIRCRTTPGLLIELVEELLGRAEPGWHARLRRLHRRHRGNVRDAIRELYDRWAGRETPCTRGHP